MPPKVDLTGRRFGRLTVLKLLRTCPTTYWTCQCDCGVTAEVFGANLTRGMTRSCGCLRTEMLVAASVTHGFSRFGEKAPELQSFFGAKDRCNNPNATSYKNYGGRGIKFKFDSFEQFFAELGPRPVAYTRRGKRIYYSVDRINNDGHYEPGNVRWATMSQQMKNSRAVPPWVLKRRALAKVTIA